MKRILLALFAAAGLSATAARADHVDVRGSIRFGSPGYYAPRYETPRGYWRDVSTSFWVPAHWEVRRDGWGRHVRVWEPGHYERRVERVWVDAYNRGPDRDRWEHDRRGGDDRHWNDRRDGDDGHWNGRR